RDSPGVAVLCGERVHGSWHCAYTHRLRTPLHSTAPRDSSQAIIVETTLEHCQRDSPGVAVLCGERVHDSWHCAYTHRLRTPLHSTAPRDSSQAIIVETTLERCQRDSPGVAVLCGERVHDSWHCAYTHRLRTPLHSTAPRGSSQAIIVETTLEHCQRDSPGCIYAPTGISRSSDKRVHIVSGGEIVALFF
ncbi:hypothetical protein J6590_105899, partial [Homalodisca vitripennis]